MLRPERNRRPWAMMPASPPPPPAPAGGGSTSLLPFTLGTLLRGVLCSLLVLLVLLPSAAFADATDEAVRRIAKQLACPVCEGQNVADSNSGLAQDMRTVIRARVEAGESDQRILEFFVSRYGDGVLTEPPMRGVALAVWFGPLIVLALGAWVLGLLVRHWLRRSLSPPVAPAASTVQAGAVAEELRRFREEVSR